MDGTVMQIVVNPFTVNHVTEQLPCFDTVEINCPFIDILLFTTIIYKETESK